MTTSTLYTNGKIVTVDADFTIAEAFVESGGRITAVGAGPELAGERVVDLGGRTVHRIGSIEPGKLADFVVLDRDVLTCPVDEIREARVLTTVLGGEVVHEA